MKLLSHSVAGSLLGLAVVALLAACGGGGGGTTAAADQTITFGAAPTLTTGGTGTVSATGGASGNAVTFSSSTAAVCTVSGSQSPGWGARLALFGDLAAYFRSVALFSPGLVDGISDEQLVRNVVEVLFGARPALSGVPAPETAAVPAKTSQSD